MTRVIAVAILAFVFGALGNALLCSRPSLVSDAELRDGMGVPRIGVAASPDRTALYFCGESGALNSAITLDGEGGLTFTQPLGKDSWGFALKGQNPLGGLRFPEGGRDSRDNPGMLLGFNLDASDKPHPVLELLSLEKEAGVSVGLVFPDTPMLYLANKTSKIAFFVKNDVPVVEIVRNGEIVLRRSWN